MPSRSSNGERAINLVVALLIVCAVASLRLRPMA
jgi:hypothetical protein